MRQLMFLQRFCYNRNSLILLLFYLSARYNIVCGILQLAKTPLGLHAANSLPSYKPEVFVKPQSVSFRIGGSANVLVGLRNGPLAHAATINWQYSGDKQLLIPVTDVPIQAGVPNYSTQLKLASNAAYNRAGSVTLVASQTTGNASDIVSTDDAFVTISIYRADWIVYFSSVVGWIYFAAWTMSFYPQVWTNYTRKSVEGLSFDFLALNLLGFTCYSAFNGALYWAAVPQAEYRARHPHSLLQVEPNDVAFGLHAVAISIVTIPQCFIYERGGQKVSWPTLAFAGAAILGTLVQAIVCAVGAEQWLDLLYYLSYVKLAITCIKYCPQVYKNYKRTSTVGWSIGNVLLDFTGGSLSILQMFMLAYNSDDWASVLFNPTKLGLGLLSIIFDVIFMVQHYLLYSPRRLARLRQADYDEVNGSTSPTMLPPIPVEGVDNRGFPRGDALAPAATQSSTDISFI